jgi:hypothetical protein
VTREQVQAFLEANPRFASPLYRAAHHYAGSSADTVAAVAPYITKTRLQRWRDRISGASKKSAALAQQSPHMIVKVWKGAVEAAPDVAKRVTLDAKLLVEARKAAKAAKATKAAPVVQISAAAE